MEATLAPTQNHTDPSALMLSRSLTTHSRTPPISPPRNTRKPKTPPTTPRIGTKMATFSLEGLSITPPSESPSTVTAVVATPSSSEIQYPKRPPRQQRPPALRVIPVNDQNDISLDTPSTHRGRRNTARPQPTPRSTSNQIKLKQPFAPRLPRRASSLDDIHLMYQHSTPFLPGVTFQAFDQTLSPDLLLPSLPSGVPDNGIIGAGLTLPTTTTATDVSKRESDARARRFHVLMELLATELGYLNDLRILVEIYLEQLRTLTTIPLEARILISRNTEDIYHFHQVFAAEIDAIITGERINAIKARNASTAEARRIEQAIQKVCASFADQASRFQLYQSFCSGHPEALDMIRRVQHRQEWDMYEKRCAVIVAGTVKETPASHTRRHSADILAVIQGNPTVSRLTLCDFLIKPVQRICRYPMLLAQLLDDPEDELQMNVISRALKAMKDVAALVDEARRQKDIATKSKLIIERTDTAQSLSPEYLMSLGNCVLAGSLDMLYHHELLAPLSTPVKVKYMGVFLYFGWVLIVKVLKNKVYEPRHWFPLALVDVTDIPEDEALCPSSFRLSSGSHHFELAAACQREKVLWMAAINEARTKPIKADTELSNLATTESVAIHSSTSGATTPDYYTRLSLSRQPSFEDRPPMPDLGLIINTVIAKRSAPNDRSEGATPVSMTTSPSRQLRPGPLAALHRSTTRRNSATFKSLFGNDPSSILIRRASTTHRIIVDRALGDVFSDMCLSVRLQAQIREPLFQPPKLSSLAPSKALAAKNMLTRMDSVLVRRQKSLVDAAADNESTTTLSGKLSTSGRFSVGRNKSFASLGSLRERRRRSTAIPSFPLLVDDQGPVGLGGPPRGEGDPRNGSMSLPTSTATSPTKARFPPIIIFEEGPRNSSEAKRERRNNVDDSPSSRQTELSATVPSIPSMRELPPIPLSVMNHSPPPIPVGELLAGPPPTRSKVSTKRESKFFVGSLPLPIASRFLRPDDNSSSGKSQPSSPGVTESLVSPYAITPYPNATSSSTGSESTSSRTPSAPDSGACTATSSFFSKYITPKRSKTSNYPLLFKRPSFSLRKGDGTISRARSEVIGGARFAGEEACHVSESISAWELIDGESSPSTPITIRGDIPLTPHSEGVVTPSRSPSPYSQPPSAPVLSMNRKRGSRFLQQLNPIFRDS